MFSKIAYPDWETIVKKQLKTEHINEILVKENTENLQVEPFYTETSIQLETLPKIEESTQLVSQYREDAETNFYAFKISEMPQATREKIFYLDDVKLLDQINFLDDNRYISLIDPLQENSLKIDEDLVKQLLSKNLEKNLCVDVAVLQNAGASMVQQIAFALAKVKDLYELFGVEILPKILIKMAIGGQYFFEMAKIRAMKLAFYQLTKDLGHPVFPYLYCETSLRNKAKHDEENNLIRSTLELASAMIGGADAVFARDYKLSGGSELSEEISAKQSVILAYESIVNVYEDAAGGSYFVEKMTQQLTQKAWDEFVVVEEAGGYLSQLKSGNIQKKIYDHAIAEHQKIETKELKLVGVNLYPALEKIKTIESLYNPKTIQPVKFADLYE